jgi:hypothetical protein
MKRKLLRACLITALVISLCVGITISANAGPIELPMIPGDGSSVPAGLKYTVANSQVTITDYTGSATKLTIPNKIQGYPVTCINNNALADCTALTSIIIPGSITKIGDFAFSNCSSLTSITIPASVVSIGNGVFNHCSSLNTIQVNTNNLFYCNDDAGVLYNKNKTTLIRAPGAISGDYQIPDSVISIADWAFTGCIGLSGVIFSSDAPSMEANSFHSVHTKAYYPAANNTWAEDVLLSYGGNITWIPDTNKIPGDIDGNNCVDNQDVEFLLWFTLFPDDYSISVNADFNGDNTVDNQDVEYLLWHTLFPNDYPLQIG